MKWHFACPYCGERHWVEWADRSKTYVCNRDNSRSYVPPTPAEQPSAYVDERTWPQEMEDVVVIREGGMCTVPGCSSNAQTLDHRFAWAKGGRTSADNLFPMCDEHNQSKGDEDYYTWLDNISSFRSTTLGRYLYG